MGNPRPVVSKGKIHPACRSDLEAAWSQQPTYLWKEKLHWDRAAQEQCRVEFLCPPLLGKQNIPGPALWCKDLNLEQCFKSPTALLLIHFPADVSGKRKDGSNDWALPPLWEILMEFLVSGSMSGPALIVAVIWGSKSAEERSLCTYISLSVILFEIDKTKLYL